jgi:outer membrane protein W
MKTIHKVTFISLFLTLLTFTAQAQPKAGDWEFTLGGSGYADNDFDTGAWALNGSVGYFINDNFETSLRQGLGYTSTPERWRGNTRVAADWHFHLDRFVPFVGANIGYIYGDDFDDRWAAAPEVGVKIYVHEKTFLFALGEYQFFFQKARDIDNRLKDGQFVLSVGVGFNW